MTATPLWTCPDCGRSFANTNQWHACQSTSVDEHLVTKTELAASIYRAVVEALERAGEFRIHAQKTRIAFITRMTFGGVSLARKWVDLSFILPEPLDDSRVRGLELHGPTSWGHTIRLYQPEDVDDHVEEWLGDALVRGNQEALDPSAEVDPLTARQLDLFSTGFRAKVEGEEIRLPRHVAEALALVDLVTARVGGVEYQAQLFHHDDGSHIVVDPITGLGDGDQTDVFLKVGE